MKRWVHPDLLPQVLHKFADLQFKCPAINVQKEDLLWNTAKEIVEFSCKVDWISFQHKYNLGVYRETK